jgi:4-diphosphocytidyl-2-C-methyl-D-erythritol kinase
MTTRVLAYAKLNLSLAVLGRRIDGFHEIDSIVQTIDLADRLDIDVAPGDSIDVTNSLAHIQGPDLASQAAAALLAAKGVQRHVRVQIEKGIPAGAGLGGGSSDAAAVIRTLDRLIEPSLSGSALASVAAGIGSDVTLFLSGGRVRITGRGEIVQRLPASSREHFAVIVPAVRCPTADVYGAWAAHHAGHAPTAFALGRNDLLAPALAVRPELQSVNDAVSRCGALYAGMSGSGSSFYAAFDHANQAHAAARALQVTLRDCAVHVCSSTDVGHLDEGRSLHEDRD